MRLATVINRRPAPSRCRESVDVADEIEVLKRLFLAGALGALIGFEREWRMHPAGLRTNTLIALGSALFTLIAVRLAAQDGGDVGRIPAQIVTGIGFLGGGAILRHQGDVRGLTTAATIWVNAAIGMAAGAGLFLLATTGTVVTLIVLTAFVPIDRYLTSRGRRAAMAEMAEHALIIDPDASPRPRSKSTSELDL